MRASQRMLQRASMLAFMASVILWIPIASAQQWLDGPPAPARDSKTVSIRGRHVMPWGEVGPWRQMSFVVPLIPVPPGLIDDAPKDPPAVEGQGALPIVPRNLPPAAQPNSTSGKRTSTVRGRHVMPWGETGPWWSFVVEDKDVWDILEGVLSRKPVILNRAPTLHRIGRAGFKPILGGSHIKLHPLVSDGFVSLDPPTITLPGPAPLRVPVTRIVPGPPPVRTPKTPTPSEAPPFDGRHISPWGETGPWVTFGDDESEQQGLGSFIELPYSIAPLFPQARATSSPVPLLPGPPPVRIPVSNKNASSAQGRHIMPWGEKGPWQPRSFIVPLPPISDELVEDPPAIPFANEDFPRSPTFDGGEEGWSGSAVIPSGPPPISELLTPDSRTSQWVAPSDIPFFANPHACLGMALAVPLELNATNADDDLILPPGFNQIVESFESDHQPFADFGQTNGLGAGARRLPGMGRFPSGRTLNRIAPLGVNRDPFALNGISRMSLGAAPIGLPAGGGGGVVGGFRP